MAATASQAILQSLRRGLSRPWHHLTVNLQGFQKLRPFGIARLAAATGVVAVSSLLSFHAPRKSGICCDSPSGNSPERLLPSHLLSEGTVGEIYTIHEEIGRGGFAIVFRCVNRNTGARYAIKKQEKVGREEDDLGSLAKEVEILRLLGRNALYTSLVDCFEDDEHVYMVLELCHGLDVLEWLNLQDGVSQEDLAALIGDMVRSVVACQESGVLHLDIKLENFVMSHAHAFSSPTEPAVKLTDFGLSELAENIGNLQASGHVVGTMTYMAPELLKKTLYSPKCDIWSLGVTIFCLLASEYPFVTDHNGCPILPDLQDSSARRRWKEQIRSRLKTEGAPIAAIDLVTGMLELDPSERLSVADIFSHPYASSALAADVCPAPINTHARGGRIARQAKGCRMREVLLDRGELLFKKGDSSQDIYFVREDSPAVDVVADGFHIASVGPTGVVGEMAALTGQPRAFDVRCSLPVASQGSSSSRCALLKMPVASMSLLKEADPLEYRYIHELSDKRDMWNQAFKWLERTPFFHEADHKFIYDLAKRLRPVSLQAGDVLMRQGDPGDEMYVLREGVLDVMRTIDDASPAKVASLVAGTVVGEVEMLQASSSGRTATVIVPLSNSSGDPSRAEVLALSRQDFQAVLHSYPAMGRMLKDLASERMLGKDSSG